jgi:UTP--glucose-1-phosphate uridylyltransferase
MLPIVDKPTIQYIVEEAVASGITDILIITNRGKGIIEDHFDISPTLQDTLEKAGKTAQLDAIKDIHKLANIQFIRQIETKGLGHAVSRANTFVGSEPFVVMYGDDVIVGDIPATKELVDAYGTFGKGVLGIKPVSEEAIKKYSSLKVEPLRDNIFSVSDMVEKPQTKEAVFSLYSILGRCVLTPDIFDILENTAPGAGGEIQLTDAMKTLAQTVGMTGVDFTGTRYDMGVKLGILKATVEVALSNPVLGEPFKEYLKETVAKF